MKYYLIAILMVFVLVSATTQEYHQTLKKDSAITSPQASIDQVSWISGSWVGEAFGGETEEIWSQPSAGSMMGSFKLSQGGEVIFYELCVIREVENTIILQLKHFEKDLKGWEERNETVDFPLVEITPDKVYFDQFTFEKISDKEMHLFVVIDRDGRKEEVPFIYHRIKQKE